MKSATDRKPTQAERLLALLRTVGPAGVTAFDALEVIGCMRLASRVWDLRSEGHDVRREMITTPHTGKLVARYTLHELPPEPTQMGLAL